MLGFSYQQVRRERQLRVAPSLQSRELVFEDMELAYPHCRFDFRIGEERFFHTLGLQSLPQAAVAEADPRILHRLLVHVGLAFVPRFFRLCDFERVRLEVEGLPPAGGEFFRQIFRRGLAELRYRNGLDVLQDIAIIGASGDDDEPLAPGRLQEKALVFNGGGKDTAVAAETLKALGVPMTWLCCGTNRAMQPVAEAAGIGESVVIGNGGSWRKSRKLRRFRGHVPFNHYLAFVGLLTAYLTGTRYVVAANERSANFGNLVHRGFEINHQYTKSLDFERRFQQYVGSHVVRDISYFSLLRPLYEVQIAKIFAGYSQYFSRFMSCNYGVRTGSWCATCPKCAFLWVMLSAFLEPETVHGIFGRDPLASPRLKHWVAELAARPERPFDCVGTLEEVRLGLALAAKRGLASTISEEGWGMLVGEEVAEVTGSHLEPVARPHSIPSILAGPALEFFASCLGSGGAR